MPKLNIAEFEKLADAVRCASREVVRGMKLSPGGDAYEYQGGTGSVDALIEALNRLEDYQAGWP